MPRFFGLCQLFLLGGRELRPAVIAVYDRAHVHVRLADLAGMLGQPTRATQHLEQALALFTELNSPQVGSVRARLAKPCDQPVAGPAGPDGTERPPEHRRTG
jgi:hypothetical protein